MARIIHNGIIYDGTTAKEIVVYDSEQIKIQAKGTGSFVLKGKIAGSYSYDTIRLIKASDFSTRSTVTDTAVYVGDVSGYTNVTVEASGFDEIYCILIG